MEFQLLGPVRAWFDNGTRADLGVRGQRFVLAVLALEVNRPVPLHRLIDLTWPDGGPASARGMIHTHVSRLKSVLSREDGGRRAELASEDSGYVLRCGQDMIDAHRFVDLRRRAGEATDDRVRLTVLDEALAQWRGPVLAGTGTDAVRHLLCGRLEEARLAAIEERIDVRLRLRQHRGLIEELTSLASAHPDRQRLCGQLMLALYRDGRSEQALAVYRATATRLADELGIDPDERLRRLHLAILRHDPGLRGPATPRGTVPRQVPAPPAPFAGRTTELETLTALAARATGGGSGVVLSTIDGMPGAGKTALVLHWAHRVAGRFPGGQLYADLRGFHPDLPPVPPGEVVHAFLAALGIRPELVPAGLAAQAALYRSLLAGRRMLVVLDGARDADQVRPLLPASGGCMAVVTSRNRLTSLVVAEGGHRTALGPLGPAESRHLLRDRIGPDRVAAEPGATDEIIARCGALPLALALVAARAAGQPRFTLAALAGELRDARHRLAALADGDPGTDLRTLFSCSYRQQSENAQRLFRALGGAPPARLSLPATARLAGEPPARVRPLLAELTRANLLTEYDAGRYEQHELFRAYAAELNADCHPERRAALHRLRTGAGAGDPGRSPAERRSST